MRLFSLIVLFFQLFIPALSQQTNFREFSQELPQSYVYSIVQDAHGFLWIGTENGLTKYDGKTFQSFTVNDSLGDNFVTCGLVSNDNIWFGHMNGRITRFDGKAFSSPVSWAQNSWITDMEQNSKGEIWASSFSNGLALIDASTVKVSGKSDSQITVYCFKFLNNTELLVGSVDGLSHCRIQSGELKLINKIEGIPPVKVSGIEKMRDSSGFFITTENDGIYKLIADGKKFTVSRLITGWKTDLSGVQNIFEDSHSTLWISSSMDGLIRVDRPLSKEGGHVVVYSKATGYSTNSVKTTFEDMEGNIWVGNYGTGLTQITENRFSLETYSEKYGSSVNSIQISENVKWLGTGKGILKIDKKTGEVIRFYSNSHGLPENYISSLYLAGNEMWVGTENNGLYRLIIDKEKFIHYPISDGDLENSITYITGRNDQLWIGTKKGACNIDLRSNAIRWYSHSQGGLPHNSVNYILIDSQGKVWVLTQSNTLAVIENGKVGKKIIFSEKRINSLGPIIEENPSTFWIGSLGSGIFQVKEDTLINLTTREGLLSDYCYSMILDEDRNLWVGHRGGLSRIRQRDFYIKPVKEYDGIKNSCEFNTNAVFKDEMNKISFGTSEGVWTYNPMPEKNQKLIPPILNITFIKVNDKEISRQDLVLPPGNYKIEIGFIGVNLKEPDLVTYKYQLTGYDHSYVNTTGTSVIYPHLTEGDYTFSLLACSGDGVMTPQPVTIHIHVKTPLWKHWWFYILAIVIFQVIFILYNKKKELKHIQEKRILEAKVQERTFELAQKNTLLEEKQQEIINQNKELEKYQYYLEDLVQARTIELMNAKEKAEESDRLKTAILNNLSHEIRTPMNAICGFSKLLGDNSIKPKERSNYIRIINQNSESLLNLISEILDMSLIESNQLTIMNEKVDLFRLLTDLEDQFKSNNNKNIELEFINKFQKEKPVIICDNARLRQVFTNLLSNAFKFTDSGSIKFGYEFNNEKVKFFVSDTGIGIAKEDTGKIFDLFHKVENNPKKFYRGAGIGLTTNKKIIGLMGGEIWVESVVNEGSTFYFTLPLKE